MVDVLMPLWVNVCELVCISLDNVLCSWVVGNMSVALSVDRAASRLSGAFCLSPLCSLVYMTATV